MSFYPDVKAYISPSAFASWHKSKRSFFGTYFENKRFGSAAMDFGTKIHEQIENGEFEVEMLFDNREDKIEVDLGFITLFGIVDTWGMYKDSITFVDHKTGGKPWTQSQINTDLKQYLYAYMFFIIYEDVQEVTGCIQWIETYKDIDTGYETTGRQGILKKVYERDLTISVVEPKLIRMVEDVNIAYEEWRIKRNGHLPN